MKLLNSRALLRAVKPDMLVRSAGRSLNTFSHANRGSFFQADPQLTNQFDEDLFLREQLALDVPKPFHDEIEADLRQFGHQTATRLLKLGHEAETNPPRLEQVDAWGNRVDRLIVCDAWKEMKRVSAVEGLIAIPYEKKFSIYSRLYQTVKLYMYAPSSGLFTCPLAMTDGAAKTIETVGKQGVTEEAFAHLTSRDPNQFWTSGQWMTERKGGSDVASGTETLAYPMDSEGRMYRLHGYKWFSSATDSDMTITLARICDQQNKPSDKLTMFFARVRRDDNTLNGIEIQKLKNKLGTKQLPTAELLLDGMVAYRMSEPGKGISKMASMLNVTRLHNSIWAVGNMRRTINLARDYATKRLAFGKPIISHEMHALTLGNMEVECRASFLSLVFVARLLGKIECNEASGDEQELLRFLTPLIKLYTAKQAISVASEGLEAFGGQGYIEDTGLPNLLRDAQVLSIWEGTTNILSLDTLRSIQKSKGDSLKAFHKHVVKTCEQAARSSEKLKPHADMVSKRLGQVCSLVRPENQEQLLHGAREFSYSLYRLFTASVILERCMKSGLKESDLFLLKKWCLQDLAPVLLHQSAGSYSLESLETNKSVLMAGHPSARQNKAQGDKGMKINC